MRPAKRFLTNSLLCLLKMNEKKNLMSWKVDLLWSAPAAIKLFLDWVDLHDSQPPPPQQKDNQTKTTPQFPPLSKTSQAARKQKVWRAGGRGGCAPSQRCVLEMPKLMISSHFKQIQVKQFTLSIYSKCNRKQQCTQLQMLNMYQGFSLDKLENKQNRDTHW